jgi:hypothetical protein
VREPRRATDHAIPSREVLVRAEMAYAKHGHENAGFLSAEAGFLPKRPPLRQFPATHRAWDEIAGTLPELWRSASVRRALAGLPLLSAREEDLPDGYVWRASTVFSILAHPWVRSETEPAGPLPETVQRPWLEISRRLARPEPFLAYADLILYNWQTREPSRVDAMRVDNLDLLVPTVGNQEERVFYLTQVEILSQCAPIVGAVVRAQEAVVHHDGAQLERELLLILSGSST